MTIHVDADACPVRQAILRVARARAVGVVFYASRAHVIPEEEGARVIVVDSGFQAVDIRLANAAAKGDVVVTGDLGLAELCLARGAAVLSFRGEALSADRMPALLEQRHAGVRRRRGGGRTRGPKALSEADIRRFETALADVLDGATRDAGD